jgi:nitrate reductase NapE component
VPQQFRERPMSPLAKISEMIAELEGTRPKPFRVHLRRLRILLAILYRRLAAYIIVSIAVSGAVTFVMGMFQIENQTIPLLTGLFQIGVAAALGWEQMQFELGD